MAVRKLRKTKQKLFTQLFLLLLILLGVLYVIDSPKVGNSFKTTANSSQTVTITKTPEKEAKKNLIVPTIPQISPIPETRGVQSSNVGFCLSVPVLIYHHIEPYEQAKREKHAQLTVDNTIFEAHLKYLNDHKYKTISAEDLANALINHQGLPPKSIVITIDDAYKDAHTYVLPLIRRYNIVVNLMTPTGLLNNPGYMSWDDLRDMVDSGLVHVYDHTWSHFSLPHGDEAKITREIVTAKQQLEQAFGRQQKIFTYPYGSYNQKIIDILRKNGFIAAYSTIPSFLQCDSFIYSLHRNRVGNAPLSSYGL